MTDGTVRTRQDSALLHFIKEVPDRYLLFIVLMAMTGVYVMLRTSEILQLLIMLVGAVIALSTKKNVPAEQTIKAETIETESMDSAQVTAGTVTMEKKPK